MKRILTLFAIVCSTLSVLVAAPQYPQDCVVITASQNEVNTLTNKETSIKFDIYFNQRPYDPDSGSELNCSYCAKTLIGYADQDLTVDVVCSQGNCSDYIIYDQGILNTLLADSGAKEYVNLKARFPVSGEYTVTLRIMYGNILLNEKAIKFTISDPQF